MRGSGDDDDDDDDDDNDGGPSSTATFTPWMGNWYFEMNLGVPDKMAANQTSTSLSKFGVTLGWWSGASNLRPANC